MAVAITYLVMNIIRTLAIHSFIDNFLQKRRTPGHVIFIAYVIYYITIAIFYLDARIFTFFHNMLMNLFFAFAVGMLYHVSIQKRLICTVFIYILSIASDDFAVALLTIIFQTPFQVLLNDTLFVILGIIISVSLLPGIVKLVNPLFKNQNTELSRLYWCAVFLIPSGCIYIMHSLICQLEDGKSDAVFILITILILFSINILIFYLYDKSLKEDAIEYENIMLIQQNEAHEKQTLMVQDFQKNLNGQQHDLINHLTTIKELADLQHLDDLKIYISNWVTDTKSINSCLNTDNAVVNAMINSKLYMASQQDTTLYANVNIPADIKVSRTDLTIILGNLLDNGLEACSKLPAEDRLIRCDINFQHSILTITVINIYCKSGIDIRDGQAFSTKTDKALHGIGLGRIHKTAEKYQGMFDYKLSQVKGKEVFISRVILYV
ncbi:MAG: sensor histidine kinase [Lachnospiraceae bacterium]